MFVHDAVLQGYVLINEITQRSEEKKPVASYIQE